MTNFTEQDVFTARLRAVDEKEGFPCLSTGLFSLQPIITERVERAATDRYWRLYVNPSYFLSISADEGSMVLVHEVWHPLLRHFERAEAIGVPPEDHDLWNIAGDFEINQGNELYKRLPADCVMPAKYGLPPGLIAEEYYPLLKAMEAKATANMPGCGVCGSCAHGHAQPWELPAPQHGGPPGITKERGDIIARHVAEKIKEAAATAGNIPAGWRRWADKVLKPVVDWRDELPPTIQGMIGSAMGKVFPSYRRPSRRQHLSPDLPKPAMVGVVPRVAVIIDTSGSMTDKLLGQAVVEVDGILQSLGTHAHVTCYAVDAAVHVAQRLTSAGQMNLLGGGGTDMSVGIQRVVEDGSKNPANKANVIVVITDGYTPWPAKPPPDCRVAVLVLTKDGTTPAWACPPEHKTIRIQPAS